VAVGDADSTQGRRHRLAQIIGNVGEVQAQERGVGPCSVCTACSRLPCWS
jgi:hypothetical protein